MFNISKHVFSLQGRLILLILGSLFSVALPLNLFYILVYLLNTLLISVVIHGLYKEYSLIRYSKKYFLLKIFVMIFSFVFLFYSFLLFFKTLFFSVDYRITSAGIRTYLVIFYFLILFVSISNVSQLIKFFDIAKNSPAIATISSFSILIIIGAMLLTLPVCNVAIEKISFIDSLFISASATCVTGLSTVDIGTYYTRFGQIVVLFLIQTGGIGIITLALSLPIIMGTQTTYTSMIAIKNITGVKTVKEVFSIVRAVIFSTLLIEFIGVVFLYLTDKSTQNIRFKIFSSIFHSVSAFCNAGFSIFTDNLTKYANNPFYVLVIMILIITGGIGYPVLTNFLTFSKNKILRRRPAGLSFHTKVVLSTTGILILTGTFLCLILEWNNSLGHLSFGSKFLNALFMSVTPRTAGFNTVDMTRICAPTIIILIILMFIGASPSSTAGGIKTTTFATMLFCLKALIKNRNEVEAFKRTIPIDSIYRAMNVTFISSGIIFFSIFMLSIFEKDKDIIKIIFEAFSAFGTVGLSLGITPQLSVLGKIIIILTMLTGRVGPLSIALIFAKNKVSAPYKYPEDYIIIG